VAARTRAADDYGPDKGTTLQVNTPGVYVDALRGRCTACSDQQEALHYLEAITRLEEVRRLKRASELDEQEVARRRKRIESNDLDPFEPLPVTP
jgi:hypothetical protein